MTNIVIVLTTIYMIYLIRYATKRYYTCKKEYNHKLKNYGHGPSYDKFTVFHLFSGCCRNDE